MERLTGEWAWGVDAASKMESAVIVPVLILSDRLYPGTYYSDAIRNRGRSGVT